MFEEIISERAVHASSLKIEGFPEGIDFFPKAFSIKDKVSVLFFWDQRSIYCEHGIDWLKRLKTKLKDPRLAIVGVHVGGTQDSVQRAMERYAIPFPVIHDASGEWTRSLAISSVPTVAVLGPELNVLQLFSGESWRYDLYSFLRESLLYYRDQALSEEPTPAPEYAPPKDEAALYYPSALALTLDGYIVSDTGRNRLLIFSRDDQLRTVIGNGESGFDNGNFQTASFSRPRGLCLWENRLYIADSGNHAIRVVDLEKQEVSTLVGLGVLGQDYLGGQDLEFQHLASPWDLTADDKGLWISMTGTQQIWRYDFAEQRCLAYSGTGKALSIDAMTAETASWAQPTAIAFVSNKLLMAEMLGPSVGILDLETGASHRLPAGSLQSASGLCHLDGRNLIAVSDSIGQQIYLYDMVSKKEVAMDSTHLELSEPMGLAWDTDQDVLYIADSGNHQIRKVPLP